VFDDDVEQGRSKSLGSSLSYGFEYAFNEDERKRTGCVFEFIPWGPSTPAVLRVMGDRENPDRYENFVGLSREYWVGLLNRAVENRPSYVGWDEDLHRSSGAAWFFRGLFEKYYPRRRCEESPAMRVTLAFAEAIVV